MDSELTPEQLQANVPVFWDTYAENYLRNTHDEYRPLENSLIFDLFKLTAVPARILDLGCGYGRLVSNLKEDKVTHPIAHYTGLDCSKEMLKLARAEHPEFTFVEGRLEDFPQLVSGKYDLFFALTSLGFLEREAVPLLLTQLREVLAPEGHALLFLDYGEGETLACDTESEEGRKIAIVCREWLPEDMRRICEEAGFGIYEEASPCQCHFYLSLGPKR